MKNSPRVSVYLVNHNYGRFLKQAIESVLSQTMEDYELIIIDNGSTDTSRDIIKNYAQLPNIVAILQEPIKHAFGISDTQLGLLTGVMFALFYATLGMPMAMWADRRNRRNLITFSITLWSGMTALCGAALQFWQLLITRVGVGVGEAGSNPPSHSVISDLYGPTERATAMAIFGVGVNIGIMLGYLIGGWVNEWLGWRWAFVVAGAPGLIIALMVRFTMTVMAVFLCASPAARAAPSCCARARSTRPKQSCSRRRTTVSRCRTIPARSRACPARRRRARGSWDRSLPRESPDLA